MPTKITTNINPIKITNEYKSALNKSRMMVKSEIAKDCSSVIPHNDGTLQQSVAPSIRAKDPYLVWNVIYAKFLYYGKVMIGQSSRRVWAKKYEKKITTNRNLKFGKDRKAHWFDVQKEKHIDKWIKIYAKGAKR